MSLQEILPSALWKITISYSDSVIEIEYIVCVQKFAYSKRIELYKNILAERFGKYTVKFFSQLQNIYPDSLLYFNTLYNLYSIKEANEFKTKEQKELSSLRFQIIFGDERCKRILSKIYEINDMHIYYLIFDKNHGFNDDVYKNLKEFIESKNFMEITKSVIVLDNLRIYIGDKI